MLFGHAQFNEIPGKRRIKGKLAQPLECTRIGDQVFPDLIMKIGIPCGKYFSFLIRLDDDLSHPGVPSGEYGFHDPSVWGMKIKVDIAEFFHPGLEYLDLRKQRGYRLPSRPLKGSMRLGNKRGERDMESHRLSAFPDPRHDSFDQPNDRLDILFGLAGEADHEIHLNSLPAVTDRHFDGIENFLIGHILVDLLPQPFASRFRHDGDTRLAKQV